MIEVFIPNQTESLKFDLEEWLIFISRKWSKTPKGYFNSTKHSRKTIILHREIVGAKKGDIVDHLDGDRFNFLRSNLKIGTNRENLNNPNSKKRRGCTSKYKGVSWNKKSGKWEVSLFIDYKRIWVGSYDNEEKAASAYNEAVIKYIPDNSKYLNKIEVSNQNN